MDNNLINEEFKTWAEQDFKTWAEQIKKKNINVDRKMLDIAIKAALQDELPTTDGATNWLFRDLVSNYYKELCSLEFMIEDEIRKTAELRSSVGPSEDEIRKAVEINSSVSPLEKETK